MKVKRLSRNAVLVPGDQLVAGKAYLNSDGKVVVAIEYCHLRSPNILDVETGVFKARIPDEKYLPLNMEMVEVP